MNNHEQEVQTQTPKRVRHAYTQTLKGTPEQVFPLLCPVREHHWAPGWATDWIISNSGLVERDCMFQTPAPSDGVEPSIWIVSRHAEDARELEMYKVTPGHTVGKLEITLREAGENGTRATVAYEFTSLGAAGDDYLRGFTAGWYEAFMKNWETALNHYLETGAMMET